MNTTAIIACTALGIGLSGIFWRIAQWFRLKIGPEGHEGTGAHLLVPASRAVVRAVFSTRLMGLLRSLFWEVLLQGHVLKQDWRRGLMHLAFFYGLLLLVVFHALDDFTSTRLWVDYAATLNPWRFLRNLCGALILLAIFIAVRRRRSDAILRRTRSAADRVALVLLAAMVLSGILLESIQILSPSIFDAMVEDYMFDDDPAEIKALNLYWQSEFGAAAGSPGPAVVDADTLALGREMHEAYCGSCHGRPQTAILSYPLSRILKPLAIVMDRMRFETIIWYFHFLTACLGLALLPFSKFFHLIATPVSLLARSTGPAELTAANLRPVRRIMGLDACTHCGVCSQHCAVAIIYRAIPNPAILPSEKIEALKAWVAGTATAHAVTLSEGSFVCTACGRCTRWCPSGIDLQDLWRASMEDLTQKGFPPAHGWIRSRGAVQWAARVPATPPGEPLAAIRPKVLGISESPETFWACVQCTTCTSVCPVVAVSEDSRRDLDLTPQQVMNLMRLQLRDLALGARMVWDCVTCYQCQENCPQGVKVADILYELRNEAVRRLRPEHPLKAPNRLTPKA